jgi:DegV family protein with EDD domain
MSVNALHENNHLTKSFSERGAGVSSIAIVTDSDSSLPTDLAARYNIAQIPITIHFERETLSTGVDIDDAALFARIDHVGKLPTTAAPSPGKFVAAYQAAFAAGAKTVLCFTVSSSVSASYAAAMAARDELADRDIAVIDTRSLSLGQGFPVLAAAQAAQAGASKEECIARANDVRDRTNLFAALSTLKYLAMSGRVGHLAAGMATLLNVKPILTIRDGKLDLLERVRTQSKAWSRVIELAEQSSSGHPIERTGIIHVNALSEAKRFEKQLRASIACPDETLYAELTPGLSVHSGAGLVGVVLVVSQ